MTMGLRPASLLLAAIMVALRVPGEASAFRAATGRCAARTGSVAVNLQLRGSMWAQPEDEPQFMPEGYKPDMTYPGTLRPGTTPENDPMDSLPQYILHRPPNFLTMPWHIRWGAPHGAAQPIEEFVEKIGRWYTLEDQELDNERDAMENKASILDVLEPEDMLGDDDTSVIEDALGMGG